MYERPIAGVFIGIGAILLIWKGEVPLAATLLAGLLAFFVGEKNGTRTAAQNKDSGSGTP